MGIGLDPSRSGRAQLEGILDHLARLPPGEDAAKLKAEYLAHAERFVAERTAKYGTGHRPGSFEREVDKGFNPLRRKIDALRKTDHARLNPLVADAHRDIAERAESRVPVPASVTRVVESELGALDVGQSRLLQMSHNYGVRLKMGQAGYATDRTVKMEPIANPDGTKSSRVKVSISDSAGIEGRVGGEESAGPISAGLGARLRQPETLTRTYELDLSQASGREALKQLLANPQAAASGKYQNYQTGTSDERTLDASGGGSLGVTLKPDGTPGTPSASAKGAAGVGSTIASARYEQTGKDGTKEVSFSRKRTSNVNLSVTTGTGAQAKTGDAKGGTSSSSTKELKAHVTEEWKVVCYSKDDPKVPDDKKGQVKALVLERTIESPGLGGTVKKEKYTTEVTDPEELARFHLNTSFDYDADGRLDRPPLDHFEGHWQMSPAGTRDQVMTIFENSPIFKPRPVGKGSIESRVPTASSVTGSSSQNSTTGADLGYGGKEWGIGYTTSKRDVTTTTWAE